MAYRSTTIQWQPRTARKIPHGANGYYLDVDGIASQAGIAEYREGNRMIREYTPPDVLQDPVYLTALEGAPLTRRHPSVGLMSDPGQIQKNVIGVIRKAIWDPKANGNRVTVRFYDPKIVENEGFNGLSVGYTADTDDQPGNVPGVGSYDRRQTKRTAVNHVASTDNPRYDGCRLDEGRRQMPKMIPLSVARKAAIARLDELMEAEKQGAEMVPAEKEDEEEEEDGEEGESQPDPNQQSLFSTAPASPGPAPQPLADQPMPKQDACGPRKDQAAPNAAPAKPMQPAQPMQPMPKMDGSKAPMPGDNQPPVPQATPVQGPPPERMDDLGLTEQIASLAFRTGVQPTGNPKQTLVNVLRKAPDLNGGFKTVGQAVIYAKARLDERDARGTRRSVVDSEIKSTFGASRMDEQQSGAYLDPKIPGMNFVLNMGKEKTVSGLK